MRAKMAMTANSYNLLFSCSWYKTLDSTVVNWDLIGGLKTLDDTMVIWDLMIGGSNTLDDTMVIREFIGVRKEQKVIQELTEIGFL